MTKIWRYMDFWKFESLLQKKCLYFSVAATQTDKLEGTYPSYNSRQIEESIRDNPLIYHDRAISNQKLLTELRRKQTTVSCWHINENENPRMWEEYITNLENGLVIQTTKDLLEQSLSAFSHPRYVEIKNIRYVDYENGGFSDISMSPDYIFFHKNLHYTWENELRALLNNSIRPIPHHEGGMWTAQENFDEKGNFDGLYVPISPEKLIQKIILSPKKHSELRDKVLAICQVYNLDVPVNASSIKYYNYLIDLF